MSTAKKTKSEENKAPQTGYIMLLRMDKLVAAEILTQEQADRYEDMLQADKEMEDLAIIQVKAHFDILRKRQGVEQKKEQPEEKTEERAKKAAPKKRSVKQPK